MSWSSRKKKECIFCNIYFFQKNFFNISSLSQCTVYWINSHILLHIKKYNFTHESLQWKPSTKAFSVSLIPVNNAFFFTSCLTVFKLMFLFFIELGYLFQTEVLIYERLPHVSFSKRNFRSSVITSWTYSICETYSKTTFM